MSRASAAGATTGAGRGGGGHRGPTRAGGGRSGGHRPERGSGGRRQDLAAGHDEGVVGEGRGALRLVGGDEHGGTPAGGAADELVEQVTVLGIEAGVGLVEEPEFRGPGHEGGKGGAAPLAGGKPPGGDRSQPPGQTQPHQRRLHGADRAASGADRETHVVLDGQVVVQGVGVAEHPDPAAHGSPVDGEVAAEHVSGSRHDRQQPRARPQQARLAGAVGALQQRHVAPL